MDSSRLKSGEDPQELRGGKTVLPLRRDLSRLEVRSITKRGAKSGLFFPSIT